MQHLVKPHSVVFTLLFAHFSASLFSVYLFVSSLNTHKIRFYASFNSFLHSVPGDLVNRPSLFCRISVNLIVEYFDFDWTMFEQGMIIW